MRPASTFSNIQLSNSRFLTTFYTELRENAIIFSFYADMLEYIQLNDAPFWAGHSTKHHLKIQAKVVQCD